MGLTTKRLTASRLRKLASRPKAYTVGDIQTAGLLVYVGPTHADGSPGAKSWWFRFRWGGKRQTLTLGQYPDVAIGVAQDLARKAREAMAKGIDPRRAGIVGRAPPPATVVTDTDRGTVDSAHSIETLIEEYLHRYVAKRGKNPERSRKAVGALLAKELKSWAGRDARTITPREVVDLLDGIVDRGSPKMANRFSGTLSKLFKLGVQRAIVDANPVQILIKPGGDEKPRDRVLSDAELGALLPALDDVFTHAHRTAAAIRIIVHTACRRSEIALARWNDFQLTGKAPLWTVPPELSKTGVPYLIPLVPAVVMELKRLKVNARNSRFVFPAKFGDKDAPANPLILTRSLERNLDRLKKKKITAKPFVLHDLRRTVRTGLARLGIQPHIAERVLNHAQRGVVATYDLHQYADEKRAALDRWAAHLAGLAPD